MMVGSWRVREDGPVLRSEVGGVNGGSSVSSFGLPNRDDDDDGGPDGGPCGVTVESARRVGGVTVVPPGG
ncbi:MAG: hypothetical protein N2689_03175 [Verrucomicrobiae bacterium]|nr:hypothetical protein [Verrucomicrobiae bacterium]